ncbi:hypothetical protein RhiirC2_808469 [Rhizophagus irregularis]|uniref:Helitron helicase-like domain-containing protein n=1 Tax=Rhizophagus irregularis TaxID=588596 RepID=A0A2N1MVN0_9GLOM|nr:hypothetical protein RhiirC2_808469 [Rhizophagus irregularis]
MLYNLLTSNDPNTDKPYVDNIRAYNSIFAFTSLGANIDEDLANAKEGVYTFQIQGALYHRIGGLMPKENYPPAFAQIYFYDSNMDNQLKRRQEIFPNLNSDMLSVLQTELYDIENPFVHNFITAGEQAKRINNIDDMRLIIHKTYGKDMRQYNKPTASEVAVILQDFNDFNQVPDPRDIVIRCHEDKLKHINELHGAYDPLQYPLLFPYGEYGWHNNEQPEIKQKQVTIREFVVYRIQVRDSNRSKSILHLSGRLFQQYLVDQYAKWESNNLRWYRDH